MLSFSLSEQVIGGDFGGSRRELCYIGCRNNFGHPPFGNMQPFYKCRNVDRVWYGGRIVGWWTKLTRAHGVFAVALITARNFSVDNRLPVVREFFNLSVSMSRLEQ